MMTKPKIYLVLCMTALLFLPARTLSESRLINISTNSYVDSNGMLAGFIIDGDFDRQIIIVGESLDDRVDPKIKVTNSDGSITFSSNNNWQESGQADLITSTLGRTPNRDTDAVLIVTLSPGTYLAHLEADNDQQGRAVLAVNDFNNVLFFDFSGLWAGEAVVTLPSLGICTFDVSINVATNQSWTGVSTLKNGTSLLDCVSQFTIDGRW